MDGVVEIVGNIIEGILGGGSNGAVGGSTGGSVGSNGNVGVVSGNLGGVSGGSGGSAGSWSVSYGAPNDISSGVVVIYPGSGPLKRAIYNMNGEYSDIVVAPPVSNEYVAQDGSLESIVFRLASASFASSAIPTRLVLKARAEAVSSAHSSYLSSVSAQAVSSKLR